MLHGKYIYIYIWLMSDTNSFSATRPKGLKNNVAILLKRLRSRDMA